MTAANRDGRGTGACLRQTAIATPWLCYRQEKIINTNLGEVEVAWTLPG